MKNKNLFIFFTLLLFVVPLTKLHAQQQKKETADEYVARVKNMVDSIKKAKEENKAKGIKNTGSSASMAVTTGKYNTKKAIIDNAFTYLTAAEKEKVKNFPAVPEAFRTNLDAQAFLDKLAPINFKATVAKYYKENSASLTGYCIAYHGLSQKAEAIVKEAAGLKAAFERNNSSVKFGANVGKTYISEGSLVYLPLGETSFADELVNAKYGKGDLQFKTENVLGTPDYVQMKKLTDNKGIYSLGLNGTLTVKFTNNALVDVNGPDLFVFEAGEIEPTDLEISKDGNTWIKVGIISGGTAAVDISKFVKPNEQYYYVRLTDRNTESVLAGADIDAIAAIGAAIKLSLNAEVLFDFGKADLKAEGIAAIKKLAQQIQTMPGAQLTIDGFTDDIGNDEANNKLSLLRAQAVSTILKQELKNKTGFIFKESGKGKANPVAPNNSDENRKKNRRVEILVSPN